MRSRWCVALASPGGSALVSTAVGKVHLAQNSGLPLETSLLMLTHPLRAALPLPIKPMREAVPVDTATLTETIREALQFKYDEIEVICRGMSRKAAEKYLAPARAPLAALSSLETRLEASEAQLARYVTAHDGPDGSYARALAAEADKKALREYIDAALTEINRREFVDAERLLRGALVDVREQGRVEADQR